MVATAVHIVAKICVVADCPDKYVKYHTVTTIKFSKIIKSVVLRWLTPQLIIVWCKWVLSALNGEFPLHIRIVITRSVSITGCAITAKENAMQPLLLCVSAIAEALCIVFNVNTQNIIPKKCEPASPMNILFFFPNTLYTKKGNNAPIIAIDISVF